MRNEGRTLTKDTTAQAQLNINGAGIQPSDITSINFDLLHIWKETIADIATTPDEHSEEFWAAKSCRSHIISKLLDLEISRSSSHTV